MSEDTEFDGKDILDALEETFCDGQVTAKYGELLQRLAEKYHFADPSTTEDGDALLTRIATDSHDALENRALVSEYAEITDRLLTFFAVNEISLRKKQKAQDVSVEDVSDSPDEHLPDVEEGELDEFMERVAYVCLRAVDDDVLALQYTCLPYIAAALDEGRFEELILEHKGMSA